MSFIDVKPGDIECFTVVTHPNRTFISSSNGVTGSVYIYQERSHTNKEFDNKSIFIDSTYVGNTFDRLLNNVQQIGQFTLLNSGTSRSFWDAKFHNTMEHYMEQVNASQVSSRKFHKLNISRFTPTVRFTEDTCRKLVIKDILNPYYRVSYPTAQWAYTNYHSLNFFTSSNTPNQSALLYPITSASREHDGYCTGSYIPSGAFSFDFYINPRYQSNVSFGSSVDLTNIINVGTILHLSSTYALSLIPGTSRDANNKVDYFRLMLQLSHSADVNPTTASTLTSYVYPNDLIFLSNDNSLKYNKWHHVVIRWGTNLINNGTGSFNIDGVDQGIFVVPSSTIAPQQFINEWQIPSVLTLGNYFESNGAQNIGNNIVNFFGNSTSIRDGIINLPQASMNINEPQSYSMSNPLNAELHDVAIREYYMDNEDIQYSSSMGIIDDRTLFYVPPFFTSDSPFRTYVNGYGGILQTPFFEINGTTDDPFNVAMSFGVAGHYINLENFVKDFATNVYPRCHQLTGSAISYTTQLKSANEFLYDDPFVVKRNLTILPCDDGNFRPNFDLLMSESNQTKYVDDIGNVDYSLINLSNLLNENAQLFGAEFSDINSTNEEIEQYANELIGFTPEQPGLSPGSAFIAYKRSVDKLINDDLYDAGVQASAPLTIYQRTLDNSSNQVTFFNISNLFYGDQIYPGSLTIKDICLSGSNNHIQMILKDDSYGNLYRANSLNNNATWNSIGNVYYNEGIILIKSPHLNFFGKEQFEITFKGVRNVHVMNINAVLEKNKFNQSLNPNWKDTPYSSANGDQDKQFTYITNVNFHDDNYNIIAKAQLAQPIMKRFGTQMKMKFKIDF